MKYLLDCVLRRELGRRPGVAIGAIPQAARRRWTPAQNEPLVRRSCLDGAECAKSRAVAERIGELSLEQCGHVALDGSCFIVPDGAWVRTFSASRWQELIPQPAQIDPKPQNQAILELRSPGAGDSCQQNLSVNSRWVCFRVYL